MRFLTRYDGESVSLSLGARKSGLHASGEGERYHFNVLANLTGNKDSDIREYQESENSIKC